MFKKFESLFLFVAVLEMEQLFTNRYREVTTFNGHTFHLDSRWICALFKEPIGKNKDLVTLIDNYCEIYCITVDNGVIECEKGQLLNNRINLLSKNNTLFQLPDIAIDVLQTINHPVGLETLCRIAKASAERRNHKYAKISDVLSP